MPMPRLILTALALLAPLAAQAAAPELLCDSDAKVTFQSRWITGSSVTLSTENDAIFPWSGQETAASGAQLKESIASNPEVAQEIGVLPDNTSFVEFREGSAVLLIERDLLRGTEDDGLVLSQQSGKFRAFHCRSR